MASGERGYTLLGVLFLLVVLGLGLAALGRVWETSVRRDKEADLLFVGDQYRRAIESYYKATPGTEKHYPQRLEDLLEDNRFPDTRRHLRQIFRDPLSNGREWGLVRQGKEILGVYSLAPGQPLKSGGFPPPYEGFASQENYQGWQFVAGIGGMLGQDGKPAQEGEVGQEGQAGQVGQGGGANPAVAGAQGQESSYVSRLRACQEARTAIWQACPQNLGPDRSACLAAAQKEFLDCMAGR